MTTFLASYDTETQVGTLYSPDVELEMIVALVDDTMWMPLASFSNGEPRPIPECFTLASELESALINARALGETQTVEID